MALCRERSYCTGKCPRVSLRHAAVFRKFVSFVLLCNVCVTLDIPVFVFLPTFFLADGDVEGVEEVLGNGQRGGKIDGHSIWLTDDNIESVFSSNKWASNWALDAGLLHSVRGMTQQPVLYVSAAHGYPINMTKEKQLRVEPYLAKKQPQCPVRLAGLFKPEGSHFAAFLALEEYPDRDGEENPRRIGATGGRRAFSGRT